MIYCIKQQEQIAVQLCFYTVLSCYRCPFALVCVTFHNCYSVHCFSYVTNNFCCNPHTINTEQREVIVHSGLTLSDFSIYIHFLICVLGAHLFSCCFISSEQRFRLFIRSHTYPFYLSIDTLDYLRKSPRGWKITNLKRDRYRVRWHWFCAYYLSKLSYSCRQGWYRTTPFLE